MVNPQCFFWCQSTGQNQPGVAIVLKKLLRRLDNLGIQHTDESSIRRQLRKRSDCKTTANQHFLMKGSTSTDIDRKRGDTRNLSCVILPRKDIPKQFFSLISTGKFIVIAVRVKVNFLVI